MAVSLSVHHRIGLGAHHSQHEGKQIKALFQGPEYGRSLDEKISDVEKQSVSVERCIERLMREKIARTDSRTEQTVHLARDIRGDTTRIQAATTGIEKDSAASRTSIERIEASQAAFAKMIRKMQRSMQTLLQDSSRNRECTSMQAHTTSFPINL